MGIKRKSRIAVKHCAVSGITDVYQELAKVIQEEAPDAIKAGEIKNQFGRKVAIVGVSLPLTSELL